ncbi:serine/threonine protein kinase [Persicimonas caeni]|uniref:Serine/threonine protein kinase n=1 Tax=Persicimonas caeni TaxID=2292766 RepID=A0A4Y6PP78_PERCE|nr:serine/threonine-protein kinase [Persicimonas caeni]QDG50013.1 serine/threonine protein kinase [Persicimonas caeni]QED31234.1 serine/threonine protein kinase [Persicimonas caeni]
MGPDPTSTETPQASTSESLAAGDVLNERYRIVEELGSGGYGQVLAAEDLQEGRRVAIKILRADAGSRDPAAMARMRQEAEILEAIDHPNIVEIYDVDEADAGEFMVMELLEGHSIDALLETEGAADPERVRPLVKQLLDALSAAHRKQVLHRDLKPENIILVPAPDEPGGERAKLLDFGIAKASEILDDDPDEGITLVKTRGGGFVGTPRYCAPEIAVGDPAGPSADMFSLGLVMAEWLTGKPRIEAEKQNRVLSILIQPTPLDVSDCPQAWQPWLSRMIAKDPDQRYPSAQEALDAFEALVEGGGADVDLAKTERQKPISNDQAFGGQVFGDDDVSETAATQVREPLELADIDDEPTQDYEEAPAFEDHGSNNVAMSTVRFVMIAAISCGVVLLLLWLARLFLGAN